jgi:hypothetical protein
VSIIGPHASQPAGKRLHCRRRRYHCLSETTRYYEKNIKNFDAYEHRHDPHAAAEAEHVATSTNWQRSTLEHKATERLFRPTKNASRRSFYQAQRGHGDQRPVVSGSGVDLARSVSLKSPTGTATATTTKSPGGNPTVGATSGGWGGGADGVGGETPKAPRPVSSHNHVHDLDHNHDHSSIVEVQGLHTLTLPYPRTYPFHPRPGPSPRLCNKLLCHAGWRRVQRRRELGRYLARDDDAVPNGSRQRQEDGGGR